MNATRKILCACFLGAGALLMTIPSHAATDDDKKFLATASQGDVNEIKISELAEQKASDPRVKAFAGKMVKEHKQLEVKMKPFAESWGLTPPEGVDADHQKEWDKLNGLSGKDFDKEYMSAMVDDHAKALDLFTKEAKDSQDAKFKTAVISAKTAVAAHKNMAYDLKKKL